jgi:hypothetical protein
MCGTVILYKAHISVTIQRILMTFCFIDKDVYINKKCLNISDVYCYNIIYFQR